MNFVFSIKSGWVGAAALGAFSLAACASAQDVTKPGVFTFDAGVEEMAGLLEGVCASQTIRNIEPPQIPGATSQTQIDCEGFDYFGAPRLAEFVFGDDALTLVWILTQKSEEADLIAAFKKIYGTPSHETSLFTAFADDLAAVRYDPPEALYYSQSAAQSFRDWFDQQASQNEAVE